MRELTEKKKLLKETIKVGVASCLLGKRVRYNAGDKYDEFIVETLGHFFDWVPVCPEFEVGFGVPRESMRLVKKGNTQRLVTVLTNRDLTDEMLPFCEKRVIALKKMGLRGYILKKASPSCGMDRVRVYQKSGIPSHDGRGLFAAALMTSEPSLPVEEEGRLHNPVLRENWVERVFAYHDLKNLLDSPWSLGDLVKFQTRYKLVLLSHSTVKYQELGRLVANAKGKPRKEFAKAFEREFMMALSVPATTKKHTNVLQHMLGYLKKDLDSSSKRDILSTIDDYRLGLYPLSVPVTLLRHFIQRYATNYLLDQVYLNPHPKELALRNFIPAGDSAASKRPTLRPRAVD